MENIGWHKKICYKNYCKPSGRLKLGSHTWKYWQAQLNCCRSEGFQNGKVGRHTWISVSEDMKHGKYWLAQEDLL